MRVLLRGGFSLVQMLVAIGLAAILSVAVMQIMGDGFARMARLGGLSDFQDLKNEYRLAFGNNDLCLRMLKGNSGAGLFSATRLVSASSVRPIEIKIYDVNTGSSVALGSGVRYGNLEIQSVRIEEAVATTSNPDLYFAKLVVVASGQGNPAMKPAEFKMYLETVAGHLVGCYAESASTKAGESILGVQGLVTNGKVVLDGDWSLVNLQGSYTVSDSAALSGTIWKDRAGDVNAALTGATGGMVSGKVTETSPACIWASQPRYRVCVTLDSAGQVGVEAGSEATGQLIKHK